MFLGQPMCKKVHETSSQWKTLGTVITGHSSDDQKHKMEGLLYRQACAKRETLSLKTTRAKSDRRIDQEVAHLPSKHKALSSNSGTSQKEQRINTSKRHLTVNFLVLFNCSGYPLLPT
jgi:hypothetical protein